MVAEKLSDGYPRRFLWCFYGSNKAITVALTEANPSVEVDIELPPKAGKVIVRFANPKVGTFIPAGIDIRSRYGTCWVGTGLDANDPVQIPSGVDIDLTVEAVGYADCSYSDTHDGAALNVKPDETVVLDVKLKPLNGH
jgi:hypothetical protein